MAMARCPRFRFVLWTLTWAPCSLRLRLIDLRVCRSKIRARPLCHWMQPPTVQAFGLGKPGPATGTRCPGRKRIERLPALTAFPIIAEWWGIVARGAGEPYPPRQLGHFQESPRMLKSSPAIHEHEERENAVPDGMPPQSKSDESGHAHKTEQGGDHQASRPSYDKPKQRAENLAAVQRIDGQHVEDQQNYVNGQQRSH